MFSTFDISTSALVAQRARVNAIASNMANMSTQRNENGDIKPYQARFVIFETDDSIGTPDGGTGVKVASVETENIAPNYKHQPNHPLAITTGDKKGYVAYPRINMVQEMVDSMEAARAYEANLGVMDVTKNMMQQTLQILS